MGSSLEFRGGGFTNAETQDFSDFFSNLFGGGAFQDYKQHDIHMRGEDTHSKVLIDLGDAYEGNTRQFSFRHVEVGADGRPQAKERTLNVNIPKGVRQGQHIRLAKHGSKGLGEAPPGDLYLEIDFTPDSIYRVEGADVYLNLPVMPWGALSWNNDSPHWLRCSTRDDACPGNGSLRALTHVTPRSELLCQLIHLRQLIVIHLPGDRRCVLSDLVSRGCAGNYAGNVRLRG